MNTEQWIAVGAWAAVVITLVGGIIVFSNRLSAVEGAAKALGEWLKSVAAGDTKAHESVLKDIERHKERLDEHATKIESHEKTINKIAACHLKQHGEAIL